MSLRPNLVDTCNFTYVGMTLLLARLHVRYDLDLMDKGP